MPAPRQVWSTNSTEMHARSSQPAPVAAIQPDAIPSGWMAATGAGCEGLACISVLFVDHSCRGAGVGAALLDTATAWIQERGRIPVLDVVTAHREVIDLYRRRGWREAGTAHPAWLPETSLVLMVLDGR